MRFESGRGSIFLEFEGERTRIVPEDLVTLPSLGLGEDLLSLST